jgi:hypothetical protein
MACKGSLPASGLPSPPVDPVLVAATGSARGVLPPRLVLISSPNVAHEVSSHVTAQHRSGRAAHRDKPPACWGSKEMSEPHRTEQDHGIKAKKAAAFLRISRSAEDHGKLPGLDH